MTDQELRQHYKQVLTWRSAPDRARCPTPEALEALVEREGDETGRLETLDHAMSCKACLSEFELLRSIHAAREGDTFAGRAQFRVHRRTWVLAAAALVVTAVTLTVVHRRPDDNVVRGLSGDVSLIGPIGGALVWHSIHGAARYDVEVLDPAGAVVFHRQTSDTSVVLPAGVKGSWWVRATLSDGTERRSTIVPIQ